MTTLLRSRPRRLRSCGLETKQKHYSTGKEQQQQQYTNIPLHSFHCDICKTHETIWLGKRPTDRGDRPQGRHTMEHFTQISNNFNQKSKLLPWLDLRWRVHTRKARPFVWETRRREVFWVQKLGGSRPRSPPAQQSRHCLLAIAKDVSKL